MAKKTTTAAETKAAQKAAEAEQAAAEAKAAQEAAEVEKAAAEAKAAQEAAEAEKEAAESNGVPPLSKKNEDFAKHMLQVQKNVDAVYVVDGLFFTDKKRAEGRATAKKSHIYTVKR